jgi:hypothetical protein
MVETATVLAMLRERGAESIEHPGGTLYAHLIRVSERLAGHGAGPELQHAALVHAAYGTDGFDVVLFDRHDRGPLRTLVGAPAEALVYRYGGCDRSASWSQLASTRQVHSRFHGRIETLSPSQLRDFVDLSIVNELDVVEQSAALAEKYGAFFRRRFDDWRPLASPQVSADADAVLAAWHRPPRAS